MTAFGMNASLGGKRPFPGGCSWNTDISAASVDTNSTTILDGIAGWYAVGAGLVNDFGPGTFHGAPIGIPYVVAERTTSPVPVVLGTYAGQSDVAPYRIPPHAAVEFWNSIDPATGTLDYTDGHLIVVLKDASKATGLGEIVELFRAAPDRPAAPAAQHAPQAWTAEQGSRWDTNANPDTYRPDGWTSADAAGLPVFPGLVRYDEIASGVIPHALRFTIPQTYDGYVAPARHHTFQGNNDATALGRTLPMGARLRLKASVNITGYSAANQVILQALKTYGMILADNGRTWAISGAPDPRWDNTDLIGLSAIKPQTDMEVLTMGAVTTG
jgi:hypothetical protein